MRPVRVLAGLLLAAVVTAAPVAAAADTSLQVSVNGAPFTSQPASGGFVVGGLAPGDSTSVVIGVRSTRSPAPLSVRLISSRAGQGLARELRFELAVGPARDAAYHQVWTGTAASLADGVSTGVDVGAGADQWLRLTASVPASAGNEVAGADFRFGLRLQLADAGVGGGATSSAGSGVDGVSVGAASAPAAAPDGHGVDGVSLTGAPLALLLLIGCALGAAGGLILAGVRKRPRRQR